MSDSVTRVILNTRLDPGVQLNDTYEIDARIASGGMGEVYRGHNIQTGEPVAIKTILPELADQEAIFALFKKEATVLGRLHHDTIVRYYSFSRDPRLGRPYLAMEFVDGISLADRLQTAPLSLDEVRRLFTGVADGLALAHGAGVIHRDLSPDNIILRGGDVGRPKIIDFGIARSANVGEGTLIGDGFAGKYNFVSPEQLGIQNREVDGRSDIYSLGLVIVASLRGKPLDMGGSLAEVITKRGKVPDLSDIDPSVRPLVEAMLQPNPDDRPAGAATVSEWLRASMPEQPRAAPANGGFGGPTSAPVTGFGSRTGVQPGAAARPEGMPFAGSGATQLNVGTSIPFSTPPSPLGGSESPFGAAPDYPAAAPTSLPGSAGMSEQTGRKSGAGRYAIAAALLLLIVGGGAGAYMTGLIGPGDNQAGKPEAIAEPPADATETVETPVTETEPTPISPADTQPTAKSPEHQAIGDALEDVAKAEETAPLAAVEPPVPEPTPEATPSAPTAETTPPQPVDLPPPETSLPPAGTAPPVVPAETPVETPVEADRETQIAAAGLTKMVDVGVSWLRQYDGGNCFFVAVTSVSDDSINIKGFARDVAAFQKLYDSFMQTNGIEPEVNGHLINSAQCAATDFLKAVQPEAKDNPRLQLASDRLKSGDRLVATVSSAGSDPLDLLLVDGDGLVYNMKAYAERTVDGGQTTFEMPADILRVGGESPEMVIALTSRTGLAIPPGKTKVPAADFFPKLARQVEALDGKVGVDFAYFRLSR